MSIDVFPATVLNSTLWNGQTYEEGTFTVTGTGFSGTAPSGTAYYVRVGKQVTMQLPTMSGTSNATTFTLTGVPAALTGRGAVLPASISDNAVNSIGLIDAPGSAVANTIRVLRDITGLAFTASGAKALWNCTFSYVLP